MRSVEQVSQAALPESTDADTAVKGAQKYAQIGADASVKLLQLLVAA